MDTQRPLTERQRMILDFIKQSIRDRGYPPSLREIAAHAGIKSTNGVNDHLTAIERKGYLRRDPMTSRGLQPTDFIVPGAELASVTTLGHEDLVNRRSALVRQRSIVSGQIEAIDAELEVRRAS